MSQEKTSLEIIAPTVEEAVSRGLSQLGLTADAVDVEVLDAGSRGLFGLGSRQARVKLTIKLAPPPRTPAAPEPVRAAQPEVAQPAPAPRPQPVQTAPAPAPAATPAPAPAKPAPEPKEGEDRTLQVARETVSELLEKMKVKATVTTRYIDEESPDGPQVLVDVQGDDLSILIGRRSETLNALQYIASLIVGKELEHWVPLLIDVQGYRARRERQLRQLAHRMAEQAVHTGKRQVLEPMPANERRVIHLELRDHPQVVTESQGEEPNRKVTIFLKKQS